MNTYNIQLNKFVIRSVWSHVGWLFFLGFACSFFIQLQAMLFVSSRLNNTVKQRMKVNPRDKRRDIQAERNWTRMLFPAEVFLIILSSLIISRYDLNLVGTHETLLPSPNLNISSGESFWVDERYNCLECKFPIKKGDLLQVSSLSLHEPAGVVALPGESAVVNLFDRAQHVAVAEQLVVPPEKIGVQIWEMGRPVTQLIHSSEVAGILTRNFPSSERPPTVSMGPSVSWLPPEQNSTLLEGCDPSVLKILKDSTQKTDQESEPLFKARKYTESLTTLNAAVDSIRTEATNCPGILSLLTASTKAEGQFKSKADQAWILKVAIQKVKSAVDLKLEMMTHADPNLTQQSHPPEITPPKESCLGYPSDDGKIRLFSQDDCTQKLNGTWYPNGECLKKDQGSFS